MVYLSILSIKIVSFLLLLLLWVRTLSLGVSSRILQSHGTGTSTCFLYGAVVLLLDTVFSFPWGLVWFGSILKFRFLSCVLDWWGVIELYKTCRCITLAFGWFIFLSTFIPVHSLLKGQDRLRKKIEVSGVWFSVAQPLISWCWRLELCFTMLPESLGGNDMQLLCGLMDRSC